LLATDTLTGSTGTIASYWEDGALQAKAVNLPGNSLTKLPNIGDSIGCEADGTVKSHRAFGVVLVTALSMLGCGSPEPAASVGGWCEAFGEASGAAMRLQGIKEGTSQWNAAAEQLSEALTRFQAVDPPSEIADDLSLALKAPNPADAGAAFDLATGRLQTWITSHCEIGDELATFLFE
jgi:hypothetical protein